MTPDPIELDTVDVLGTGAVGEPGQRVFYLQARKETAQLTVLVEKEQVALLATEAVAFLDRIRDEYPEDTISLPTSEAELREPTVPLFRARLIGLGFDPERELVLIELRERSSDEDDDEEGEAPDVVTAGDDDEEGFIARVYATRPQVRAMADAAPPSWPPGGPRARSVTSRWTRPATGAPAGTERRRGRRGPEPGCARGRRPVAVLVEWGVARHRPGRRGRGARGVQASAWRAAALGISPTARCRTVRSRRTR